MGLRQDHASTARRVLMYLIFVAAGCGGGGFSGNYLLDISSGKTDVAIAGMSQAAEKKDQKAIVPLIKRLHDDDDAIRMGAISALRDITGQDMGYRSYASPAERGQAIQRWWAWIEQQNISTARQGTAGPG